MSINPIGSAVTTPAAGNKPQTPEHLPQSRELANAVRTLNGTSFLPRNRELTFSFDPKTKIPVVKVVDSGTREVIEQFPTEYVLRVARYYQSLAPKDSVQIAQKNTVSGR